MNAPNDPQIILNTTSSKVLHTPSFTSVPEWQISVSSLKDTPYTCYKLRQNPKFHSVSPYSQQFSSYWPLWHKCTELLQMTLNPKTSKVPHTHVTTIKRVWNFNLFCSTASLLRVTGHFEKSATNDPKMTFNTERSKVPIYIQLLPSSKVHPVDSFKFEISKSQ